ncbi:MAG: flagellar hook-basal body complex protein [Thermodesulfobacteriota bacterium]
MSLTSSLYSGISGMTNLGNAMQVIGDNIANVNTTGFKGSRYVFQDLLSQSIATQAGTAQVGRGMALGDVSAVFQQGSFESTGNTTDLAIGGEGFFVLREDASEQLFYTRAGNFRFDKEGVLTNPEGYVAQGWKLDDNGDDIGSVTDIMLMSFTSPPTMSEHMTIITNLNSNATSLTSVLPNSWDATATTPIDTSNYHYQTVVKVYDSLGSTHDVTVYYDKKSGSEWEYMITCNPAEDKRNLVQDTAGAGLLARGTITFSDSSGTISDMTMERFTGRIGNVITSGAINAENTTFTINNYDALPLDGYSFSLEFDGTSWSFEDTAPPAGVITAADLPDNYPSASIISGDANTIRLNLDGDADRTVDLTITFANPAQATDSLQFDINNPNNIHIQNVVNSRYIGDTANDNTTLEIQNPNVLTIDSTDLRINWDASAEEWYWSMPMLQNITNIDTGNLTPAALIAVENVTNPEVMTSFSENVNLWYDVTAGEWNFVSPFARELSNLSYSGGINQGNTTSVISDPAVLTERVEDLRLYWDNIVGVTNLGFSNASGTGVITAANTTMTVTQEENMVRDSSIVYTLEYNGALDTWNYVAGADPVVDYAGRVAPAWNTATNTLSLDLTGDGEDIRFAFAANPTPAQNGDRVSFRIDADGTWYWGMPSITGPTYGGGISGNNTMMDIADVLSGGGPLTDSSVTYNLVFTSATNTWSWGANSPSGSGDYAADAFITNDENQVSIDLDGDGTAEISYTFMTPLTADGTLDFGIDAWGAPPAQYAGANIMSTSGPDVLSLDMTGNGSADVTFTFQSPLSSDGSILFDIDTFVPPFEYPDAAIDPALSNANAVYLDLNGDGVNDVDFSFEDAGGTPQALTANGVFEFDVDPRVPPTEYPYATLSGDRESVSIDMNNDDEDDITFTFLTPLPTGINVNDSAITFDIEGSTAWTEVDTNTSGYFEFLADFLGGEEGATQMNIEFDIGTRDDGTGQFVNDSMTSTQYARSSTTTFQSADGYGAGDLQGVDVDVDGVMTGIYSNGQLIPLYRVALAKFLNTNGLLKVGGNLFRETRDSGTAITNRPGTNGLGSIAPNSLEQSNVDIATEFVNMITTQRAFQANSKIVTTVDTLLGEVINLKR